MFIFPVNSFQNRIVKRCSFYTRLKLSQLRSVLFLYHLETSENHRFCMFLEGTKGNIDPRWVKQQQYRRERHSLMLSAWNVSSSFVKQNDYKNKTTWLTQTALLTKKVKCLGNTHNFLKIPGCEEFLLKVHYCRFENFRMCLGSCKNNTLKILHS